ncbi:indoleamine 2,3-dioxygenase family protein [Aulographum hederae CBS 113979]|uniref:Indoleamine 2,3-dioxygenase n=1 Tax=Aulographum hederae CBS 113979 TaxID=1176131 RepID=A0A6G1GQT4_9PEZI|nr:indoleamine 2,3-dioxygenase family protein [Aulographum hederae CBS 113979]
MIPSLPRLSDYDVSAIHGFLPTETPLEQLPDPYYAPWETIIRNLQGLVLSRRLRGLVDTLPVLSTELLHTEPEWRRAYQVLAFIAHAYIWGDPPLDRVPPSISIPFLATCRHLELPPVATYAGVVLWNWKPFLPYEPIDNLENISTLHTFTGSLDESWFYLVSVAIEARGAPLITLMLDAISAARYNDSKTITECLRTFAETLDDLGTLLVRMYENCDPHVFYHRIRPFLAGSKNMADAGLPNGVLFDDGTPEAQYVQFSGGSNAQSSIIQFFDIVLGVEHRPTGEKQPSSGSDEEQAPHVPTGAPSNNFIKDMRTYMPGPHRRFLEHVSLVSNIRDYVASHTSNRALCTAFDAALAMLRAFRDKHIQMVSRYIILKSRESRSESRSMSPNQSKAQRRNIANTLSRVPTNEPDIMGGGSRKLRGTGGTALIPFLKQARDETGEPAIDAWARRLLNNGPADAKEYAVRSLGSDLFGRGGGARMTKIAERESGEMEIVGLAGTWSVDDSEGGICHW